MRVVGELTGAQKAALVNRLAHKFRNFRRATRYTDLAPNQWQGFLA